MLMNEETIEGVIPTTNNLTSSKGDWKVCDTREWTKNTRQACVDKQKDTLIYIMVGPQ